MSVLDDRFLRRVNDAISCLQRCCEYLAPNIDSSGKLESDGCVSLTQDETDILSNEGGLVLSEYMTNLCRGVDNEEARCLSEGLEESVQSQLLVEKSCKEIYSSVFSTYIVFMCDHMSDTHAPVCDDASCLSVPAGELWKYRPARVVLSLISDYKVVDGNVRIHPASHGKTFMKKVGAVAPEVCPLQRELHIQYIARHLTLSGPPKTIPLGHLNCSQPWIVYWTIHSLRVLGVDILQYKERVVETLLECWDPLNGGFGGGVGQIGHLATTYAAVCCFKMLDCIRLLDVGTMRKFLRDMKQDDGSYTVHRGGERDVRGSYCAIATASMMGILDDELVANVASCIAACQGYDGGIAGEPNLESHAGYVYCGTAALKLIGALNRIDTDRLRQWCLMRQTPQLGYQGRPHKLVDACYSFWIGATLAMVGEEIPDSYEQPYSMLKTYLMFISQSPLGGFRDKPGKSADLYHTCYALSALEIIAGRNSSPQALDFSLNIIQ
ncbi:geranylgeranyl transferase type beta subunit like protein [Babesia gibsoni]|uniref:Geranylgeranyl transferase type beta subunit like protein n=1 Tax=Babesia gibsoni TaxID=33632 RepID=A0AAD8PG29_BABGI|nr:geranylgeranyl transferase type beta subunit like protein [Babesia gibsoni]